MRNLFLTIVIAYGILFTSTFAADAGIEQFVNSNDLVTLDSTSSIPEKDGEIVKYKWKQIKHKGTPKIHLSNRKTATPTFIAPTVEETTELFFKLKTKEIYNCKKGKKKGCKKYKSKDTVSIFVQPKDNNTTENNETNISNITITGTIHENNCGQWYVTDNPLEGGTIYITTEDMSNYDPNNASWSWIDIVTDGDSFPNEGDFNINATLEKQKTYYILYTSNWCAGVSGAFIVNDNNLAIDVGDISLNGAVY